MMHGLTNFKFKSQSVAYLQILLLSCHLLEQVNNLKNKANHGTRNCLKRDSNRLPAEYNYH